MKIQKLPSLFFEEAKTVASVIFPFIHNGKSEIIVIELMERPSGLRTSKVLFSNNYELSKKLELFKTGMKMWVNSTESPNDIDWKKYFPNCNISLIKEKVRINTKEFTF